MENALDDDIQKRYYTITEVAEMIGQNPSVLRFWDKEFGEIASKKGSGGKRLYTEKDLERVKTIHFLLKEQRFTIDGAKSYLNSDEGAQMEAKLKTKATLERARNFLIELKNTLELMENN